MMTKDPQASLQWESKNLVCYKMARRKNMLNGNLIFICLIHLLEDYLNVYYQWI